METEVTEKPFDLWVKSKPSLLQQIEFARLHLAHLPCENTTSTSTGTLSDGAEQSMQSLCSWRGVHISWFLQSFMKTDESQQFALLGCRMWLFRNICIIEMMERRGIWSGSLIDNLDDFERSDEDMSCDHQDKPAVSEATVFVSYTGSFTLSHFAAQLELLPKDSYIWVDFLCVDQFAWTRRKDKEMMEFKKVFMHDLRKKIGRIGKTTLMLGRWDNLMPTIGKIWVLWELFSTVDSKADLSVLLSDGEQQRMIEDALSSESGFHEISKSLATIDATEATAWCQDDKKLILDLMKENDGIFNVNATIIATMRTWLLESAYAATDDITSTNLRVVGNLAKLVSDCGRWDEARSLNQLVLDKTIKISGKYCAKAARAMNNLANINSKLGNTTEAEKLLRESLLAHRRLFGDMHKDTLSVVDNLGALLKERGSIGAAEELFREAIEGRRLTLGENHLDTLMSVNNMSMLLKAKGDFAGAKVLCQQAIDGHKVMMGERHPFVLTSKNNMANLLRAEGDFIAAETMYRETLVVRQEQLGNEHPDTMKSKQSLANLLLTNTPNVKEAERLFREILVARREQLGGTHPQTLNTMHSLAMLMKKKCDFIAAEVLLRKVTEEREKGIGEDHKDSITSVECLGILLFEKDTEDVEARQIMSDVLQRRIRVQGEHHPDTMSTRTNLAEISRTHGDFLQADTLYSKSLQQSRNLFGDAHPKTLSLILKKGIFLLSEVGDRETGQALVEEAFLGYLTLKGPDHFSTQKAAAILELLQEDDDE